jgi:hypothetical protein
METYDRGSPIVIEVEIKQYTPFGSSAYIDPDTTYNMTITDPDKKPVLIDQQMTKSAVGKYYYIYLSELTAAPGDYGVQVDITHGGVSDVEIEERLFKLR